MTSRKLIAASVLALGLAACGGNDDVYVAPLTAAPAEAVASSTAFTDFGVAQTQVTSETTAEPFTLDVVTTPPTSETDEPVAI